MNGKTTDNAGTLRRKAQDQKKRADALRLNLLKRKQQSRDRKGK